MKKISRKTLSFVLVVFAAAFGGMYIADIILSNTIVVDGVLGITTINLLYLSIGYFKGDEQGSLFSQALKFPRDIKYIFLAFYVAVISYWSFQHIVKLDLFELFNSIITSNITFTQYWGINNT